MRRNGSTKRRFNKKRCRRKTLITLVVVALVLVLARSCVKEPVKAESLATEETTDAQATIEPTVILVPMARYPVPLDDDLQYFIIQLCEERHILPSIVFAMIDRESDFNAKKIGDDGASYGLMQVQPRWHYERMDELGCHDLLDPYQNVTVGIDYLAELLDYGNGLEWALMAYNSGPNEAYAKANIGAVSDYAQEVIENSEILTEGVQTVMYRTDDPLADFDRWDADQAREEAKLPYCVDCGEVVYEHYDYHGDIICLDCMDAYRRDVLPE